MRKDQICPVACAERRVDLVNAGDYDRLVASAEAGRARVRGLKTVVAELASAHPAEGEWQAAYQAVQESAGSALRRFSPPGGSPRPESKVKTGLPITPAVTPVWRPTSGGSHPQ